MVGKVAAGKAEVKVVERVAEKAAEKAAVDLAVEVAEVKAAVLVAAGAMPTLLTSIAVTLRAWGCTFCARIGAASSCLKSSGT